MQDDILRSKTLANDILKQSDAPDVSGKAAREAEAKVEFLTRELQYNQQVQNALRGIRTVSRTLDQVEQARDERHILDALHLLESERRLGMLVHSWSIADHLQTVQDRGTS